MAVSVQPIYYTKYKYQGVTVLLW